MLLNLDPIYILLIAIVVFLASYMLVSYLRESSVQKKEDKGKIVTLKKCLNCAYLSSKPYEKGDYVGKREGKCPRCDGEIVITAIYLEPPPQP
ncbi:MAG: hypothetical protein QXS63_05455 [Zestosphaera sp.]